MPPHRGESSQPAIPDPRPLQSSVDDSSAWRCRISECSTAYIEGGDLDSDDDLPSLRDILQPRPGVISLKLEAEKETLLLPTTPRAPAARPGHPRIATQSRLSFSAPSSEELEVGISTPALPSYPAFDSPPHSTAQHTPRRVLDHASRSGLDTQGSASSGLMALCGNGAKNPSWPPGMVINDYTTGYYGALAIQAALLRRGTEGGGYLLSPSLTGTAMSIIKYFQQTRGTTKSCDSITAKPDEPLPPLQLSGQTPMGYLRTLQPLPLMSGTPIECNPIFLVPLGSSPPVFPGWDDKSEWDVTRARPRKKEMLYTDVGMPFLKKMAQLRVLGKTAPKSA